MIAEPRAHDPCDVAVVIARPFTCACGDRFRTGGALRLHLRDHADHVARKPRGRLQRTTWITAGLLVVDLLRPKAPGTYTVPVR